MTAFSTFTYKITFYSVFRIIYYIFFWAFGPNITHQSFLISFLWFWDWIWPGHVLDRFCDIHPFPFLVRKYWLKQPHSDKEEEMAAHLKRGFFLFGEGLESSLSRGRCRQCLVVHLTSTYRLWPSLCALKQTKEGHMARS